MRVLVTGGAGFLGFAIVRQLVDAGFEVVTFSRGNYPELQKMGVSHVQGDLCDASAVDRAVSGCDAVIHTAAHISFGYDRDTLFRVNVDGTAHVIQSCRAHGIEYLVYTSSPIVVYQGNCEGKDERLPYPEKFEASYPETKAIAERMVLDANGPSLATCSLRPHLIWGPGDTHFLPVLFRLSQKNLLRKIGTGENLVDTVYVDNAAIAHVQALKKMTKDPESVGGKVFFVSQDEPIPMGVFVDRLLETGGFPPVEKRISPRLALFVSGALKWLYGFLGIKKAPPVTPMVVRHMTTAHWFDISAAKQTFGYQPVISYDQGMDELKKWVSAHPELRHG